ncbi:MAG: response regulator [Longimicrobiales bacterium]
MPTPERRPDAPGRKLRQSLRWRLPAFFCVLLVLMLATFLWATNRVVETTLVRAGRERAEVAADQIADMLSRAIRSTDDVNARLRNDPALRAFLRNPTERTRAAARAELAELADEPFRRVELWDADGTLVMELAQAGIVDSAGPPVFFPSGSRPTGEGASAMRAVGELAYFDLVVAVRDGTSPEAAHLGYVRRFGRITSSTAEAIKRLVGEEAVIKVGTPGGVWMDFSKVVEAPPRQGAVVEDAAARSADDSRSVGAYVPIDDVPWAVWAGFPRELIVAPAQPFMRRMILLALLMIVVGTVLAAVLGVRLTQPLHALVAAAERIAAGDYTQRVRVARHDEIGRLGGAFDTMADRVEEGYEALRQAHEQTQFALGAARIGVWESRLETGEVICSESMRLVQHLPNGALPRTRDEFLALVHPEDRDSIQRVLEGRMDDGDVFDVQWRGLTDGRSTRVIEGKGRITKDEAGRAVSVFGVSLDVTDQRRLESQLRQAQKMEAIGQLAGGVAHDFNNLLTAIVGHGNLVLGQLPKRNSLRGDVIEILKAGESAAGLTRQLLTFSRRQVLQPEVLELNDVVTHTEKLLRRLIGEHIAFRTSLAPALRTVRADRGQLEQVLVNLAVNARDAMPDGGELTITTANVDLDETFAREHATVEPGPYVMVSVTDTGNGMDAETQSHLFEPFFTTKEPGKGTGLGLATVFGIVKQSGGHIYVYSEPARGATFKIYLPATAGKPSAVPSATTATKPVGGTETILVVEDHETVRAIARRVLERMGYNVVTAASGTEALELVDGLDAPPDLVISDVIMPGMTGPELCRRLGSRHPGLRVLFTSGYSGEALGRHGVEESGAMFIEKPYTPHALAEKVREALGHVDGAGVAED